MKIEQIKTCCFIGHRKIEITEKLKSNILKIVEELIKNKGVKNFLFGSRSEFNSLCYKIVTNIKQSHPYIKRIYVRGEYQYIDDKYKKIYFLKGYENSYLPNRCKIGSKASYIERNYEMINKSNYCIFYFDSNYLIKGNKKTSGTSLAFNYATKKNKIIFNFFPYKNYLKSPKSTCNMF